MTPLQRLEKYWPVMNVLGQVKSKKLIEDIIKEYSKDEDFCVCVRQLTKNFVKKNIPLKKDSKKKELNKHERVVRGVLNKNRKVSRRFVKQSGGFLPILASAIASLVIEKIIDNVLPENDDQ